MDTDQPLEAAARVTIENPSSSPPPPSYKARMKDNNGSPNYVAKGSQETLNDENTPLLARVHDLRDDSSQSESEEADDRPPPTWSGERDFEGVPWWRTPSVSKEKSVELVVLLTVPESRSTGLCLPS